jgi:hypothetical protein
MSEGLFRVPGDVKLVQFLVDSINEGAPSAQMDSCALTFVLTASVR